MVQINSAHNYRHNILIVQRLNLAPFSDAAQEFIVICLYFHIKGKSLSLRVFQLVPIFYV